MLNLNVVGAFPLIWVMGLPGAFLLFSDHIGQRSSWAGILIGILLVIYLIRQLYISYLGLEKLFAFSSGIKILYICGFNILPYLNLGVIKGKKRTSMKSNGIFVNFEGFYQEIPI